MKDNGVKVKHILIYLLELIKIVKILKVWFKNNKFVLAGVEVKVVFLTPILCHTSEGTGPK